MVLNLVTPEHIGEAARRDRPGGGASRQDAAAAGGVGAGRSGPGRAAHGDSSPRSSTIYLAPPGYGEMFSRLGFGELVEYARGGAKRGELAARVPFELLEQVCAVGSASDVAARLSSYHGAGAALVGVVPSTAEDPGGRTALGVAAGARRAR